MTNELNQALQVAIDQAKQDGDVRAQALILQIRCTLQLPELIQDSAYSALHTLNGTFLATVSPSRQN